mmetsp:Transcript_17437/g.37984  ORF Transcript_17437/g.37984 Transcript_17437/m.37984 type:complete len:245 (-) Transcript_17437:179-913(-)
MRVVVVVIVVVVVVVVVVITVQREQFPNVSAVPRGQKDEQFLAFLLLLKLAIGPAYDEVGDLEDVAPLGIFWQVLRYHAREAVVVVGVAEGVKGGESVLIYLLLLLLLLLLLWKGSARLAHVVRGTAIRHHRQRRESVAVAERISVVGVTVVASPRNVVIAAGRRGRPSQSASAFATAHHVHGCRRRCHGNQRHVPRDDVVLCVRVVLAFLGQRWVITNDMQTLLLWEILAHCRRQCCGLVRPV